MLNKFHLIYCYISRLVDIDRSSPRRVFIKIYEKYFSLRNEYEDKGWKGWESPMDYHVKAYQIALLGDEEGRRVSAEGGPVAIYIFV